MDEHQAISVGGQVRRARKSHEWTQGTLAEKAGVAPGTVNSIENGRNVRPGNMRAVLDALGIPPIVDTPQTVDDGIKLALELVQKWLEALPDNQRDAAIQELTRFTVLGEWERRHSVDGTAKAHTIE